MTKDRPQGAITLAITGASGAPYGLRLLELLLKAGERVHLMVSDAARVVMEYEVDWTLPDTPEQALEAICQRYGCSDGQLTLYGTNDWLSPAASGSNAPRAMVVCPCSGGSLSAIASGASNNLIERAADVMIKERRPLILVPRETPLSAIHLEHMLNLSRLGVTIMPASPGFYHNPQSVESLVDFVVARILDHLGVEQQLHDRWGE